MNLSAPNFTQPIITVEYVGTTAKGTTTGFWYNDGGAPIFGVLVSIRILMALIGIVGILLHKNI